MEKILKRVLRRCLVVGSKGQRVLRRGLRMGLQKVLSMPVGEYASLP